MPHYNDLGSVLRAVREETPLVHCITNYVSMEFMANSLLAVGASPAMVHSPEEVSEFAAMAAAINLNIGTISPQWMEGMRSAVGVARMRGKPCVLDPVGIGATKYRQRICKELFTSQAITVVRGNASEIIAFARVYQGDSVTRRRGRGVDSLDNSEAALTAADRLRDISDTVVAISGATDYVCSGDKVIKLDNGCDLLPKLTATGCTLNAFIAACLAVCQDRTKAVVAAFTIIGVSAELAAVEANGPGSFYNLFIDSLHNLSSDQLDEMARNELYSEFGRLRKAKEIEQGLAVSPNSV